MRLVSGSYWSLPYSVDWPAVSKIQDAVQEVDVKMVTGMEVQWPGIMIKVKYKKQNP